MTDRVTAAAKVIDALRNEGHSPTYHRRKVEQLRSEWPTLYYALLQLEAAVEKEEQQ